MAVPTFQDLTLPVLKLAADGEERTLSGAREALAEQFHLSDSERRELLPSGKQFRLDNRVSWAYVYLVKAGLLDKTGRGRFRITDRGRQTLAENPPREDLDYLRRFPEVEEFRYRRRDSDQTDENGSELGRAVETPEEMLDSSYQRLRNAVAQELLDRVKRSSPAFFEKLVVDLLVAMGYGGSRADAGARVGQSGDGGVDGIIKEDKLGLDFVLIQAKRWQAPVGASTVRDFAGSLEGHRARKGVLITTSRFTSDAEEYVTRIEKKIVLIDGSELAQFMIDHGVGVANVAIYVVKKVDSDYFDEE